MTNRRDVLRTLGGLAGAATLARLLPACADDDGPVGITTIVYLMMENRSYDHLLGARAFVEGKGGDGPDPGATNPDLAGAPVGLWAASAGSECALDPPHGWDAARAQLDGGTNLGFVRAHQRAHGDAAAIEPMQYLTRAQVPVTYALADAYTVCDRWHASVLGPTWPNRMYWHTGTSSGIMSNSFPTEGLAWPSIYHRLDARGVDWAYYYGTIPFVPVIKDLPVEGKVRRFRQFLADAAAGALPPVVYIDPAFYVDDDHPPVHPINGQALIASIYAALATSPQWKNCLFVVTYDEHGGFYDHVVPGKTDDDFAATGFDQLGFRVPALVMGPYAKQGHVSSVRYDHASALKHLEVTFGLAPLTRRTTAANDLSDCIDLERLARGQWARPIALPPVDVDAWPMDPRCFASGRVADDHPMHQWADANRALLGDLDLRGEVPSYRAELRAHLARHGLLASR